MAEMRPFRGVRYNNKLVADLSAVLCPPYDVISPQEQETLYQRSDYNIIRLEYAKELPGDDSASGKYSSVAATFHDWLAQGVLQTDERPAVYLHDHYFGHQAQPIKRRSLIACVGLEGWQNKVIRPHENTSAQPKTDRLKLLTACQAQFSPIFALYNDPQQKIATILAGEARLQPCINLKGSNGESHVVWTITEGNVLRMLSELFSFQNLYIADGHHRYETALAYQQQRQVNDTEAGKKQSYDFTMMTLLASDEPGLVILPQHRLVKGLPASTIASLKARLEKQFSLQPVRLNISQPTTHLERLLEIMRQRGRKEAVIGVWGLEEGQFFLLTPVDNSLKTAMPQEHSEAYKQLDISMLEHAIIERSLGIDALKAEREGSLVYSHDAKNALKQGLAHQFQLVFFLNPMSVERIQQVADSGDRMPQKSTYFYPKPPTGLVIYQLESGIVA